MRKLGSGAAAVAVAGSLTIGIGLGSAAPAQAFLPVLPLIPVVGAIAAPVMVTTGQMIAMGITAAVVSVVGGLATSGAVAWKEPPLAFLFNPPKPDDPATPVQEDVDVVPPSTDGTADPLFDGYEWIGSYMKLDSIKSVQGNYSNKVVVTFSLDQATAPGEAGHSVAPTFMFQTRCMLNGVARTMPWEFRSIGRLYKLGGEYTEETFGGVQTFDSYCPDYGVGEKVVAVSVRPSTTSERVKAGRSELNQPGYSVKYVAPPGQADWRAEDDPSMQDPKYRTTVQCVSPSGVVTELSATSDRGAGMLNIPSCSEAGLGVAKSISTALLDGDTIKAPLWTALPPDSLLDCDPALGQVCKLEIEIDGIPCVVGTVQCAGWVSQHLADPSRVKCFYGAREVSISNCGVLEGAYAYGGTPLLDANTDGDPNTWTDPKKVPGWTPQPGPNGEPNVDPNPDTVPKIDNNPNGQPEPNPNPSPSPSPSPSPNPNPQTPPTTGTNPTGPNPGGDNCMGASFALNPIQWVMQPVQCALQWAFVPKMDIKARSSQIATDAAGTIPLSWLATPMTGPGGGGCPNWNIQVAGMSENVICGSSFTAAVVGVRGPLFGLVTAAMIWPLVRSIWYAAIPVLRVTPSSSK